MKPISILVADDTLIAREGLKSLNTHEGLKIIGEVYNAQDTLAKVKKLKPDIVLMDLNWFGDETAGVAEIARIKRELPSIRIIAITAYPDLVLEARKAGADAAIENILSIEEIAALIKAVHALQNEKVTHHSPIDRTSPARLAAGIMLPTLGFVIIFVELVWGISQLSLNQFWLVIIASMVVYFWGVVFAGRYVDVVSETTTYKLFERIIRIISNKRKR